MRFTYNKWTDEKLMRAIQKGKAAAVEELYDRYSQRLLHYFYRMLGTDAQKAQDFLQEVFLKIVEKPELFNTNKNFSSWIFTIAFNLCKNEYRRLHVRKKQEHLNHIDSIFSDNKSGYQHPEQKIDQELFKKALKAELEKLDATKKNIFLLRYQQNFSIKKISEIVGCSEGTIKSRLFYTNRQLADKLHEFNPYKIEGK